ncbi:hypothetical protein M3223_17180 [Paenibacillus pasadenensis]|uniref:hypothetical protein n=1 Tax=Paenibacillus pasadenensis TaxID=217090 RepID=UPI002041023F|nr:hypothetical protein [Paenibacillus pasadenensis]MCM3749092.1 hypothetical protein [Paenibacillus pasadenensis]
MNLFTTLTLAAALVLPAGAGIAAQPQQTQTTQPEGSYKQHGEIYHPKGRPGHKRFREAHKRHMLKEAVVFFGIKTDGKNEEQLIREVRAMKEKQPEKWAQFKQVMKEKRLVRLKAFAAAQGIKTEGMNEKQLREELRKLHHEGKLKMPAPAPAPAPSSAPKASPAPQ